MSLRPLLLLDYYYPLWNTFICKVTPMTFRNVFRKRCLKGTVPGHFIRYCSHCSGMRTRGLSPEGFVEWTCSDGHNALQTINNDNQRSLKVVCSLLYHETHRERTKTCTSRVHSAKCYTFSCQTCSNFLLQNTKC